MFTYIKNRIVSFFKRKRYRVIIYTIQLYGFVGEVEIFAGKRLIKKYFIYNTDKRRFARFISRILKVLDYNAETIVVDNFGPMKYLATYYFLKWRDRDRYYVKWPKYDIESLRGDLNGKHNNQNLQKKYNLYL